MTCGHDDSTINIVMGIIIIIIIYTDKFTPVCLKCPPLAHMHVFSREYDWSTDASIVRCSMLCHMFIFITERNEYLLACLLGV